MAQKSKSNLDSPFTRRLRAARVASGAGVKVKKQAPKAKKGRPASK